MKLIFAFMLLTSLNAEAQLIKDLCGGSFGKRNQNSQEQGNKNSQQDSNHLATQHRVGKVEKKGYYPNRGKVMKEFDVLVLAKKTLIYKNNKFFAEDNKAVGIKDGRIVFVGDKDSTLKAKKTYHLKHHLLSPGLINTHTHLPMSLFKSLVDNTSLKDWLENYIFPLEAQLVNENFIQTGTQLAALELIQRGTTTFADMYFYNKVMAQVLDQSGLRGIVGVGIPSVETDWKDWKNKILKLKEEYKDHKKISFGLAPHAPYTVSPEDLKAIGEFSKKEKVPIFIHVSETSLEKEEILKKYGKTPVQHLHDLGVTGQQSLFVHSVHLDKKDIEILAKTGTSVAYNPESNMKLCSGICPVVDLLDAGISVGLGTDGSGSNNNLNLIEEMDTGVKLQALKYDVNHFKAMDAFKMATIKGAQALGLEKEIGTIEEGKWADIIAFDIDRTEFVPSYNFIAQIVYSANGSEVDFTMVGGDVLMENGEVKSLDKKKIHKEAFEYGKKIQSFVKDFNIKK